MPQSRFRLACGCGRGADICTAAAVMLRWRCLPVCQRRLLAIVGQTGVTDAVKAIRETKGCDECGSAYFSETSQMKDLCPECAHHLYGYAVCLHAFVDGRCARCGWDGSRSAYVRSLLSAKQ